jgi:uncharacterized protein
MKTVHVVAVILVLAGALNWGLVGVLKFDLVGAVFGYGSILARLVYTLVGLAAVVQIAHFDAIRQRWCKTEHHALT